MYKRQVLASLLSLAGATATAAMVTPLSALAGNAFSRLLAGVGLKLCTIAAALAAAGQLSPNLRLSRLFHLVRSVVNWGAGVLMAVLIWGAMFCRQNVRVLCCRRFVWLCTKMSNLKLRIRLIKH